MNFVEELKKKAAAAGKTIVLCEGEDKRVVEAAARIVKEGIAKIILIGSESEVKSVAPDVDLSGVTLVDPATDSNVDKYAELLYKAREGKINNKTGAPEYADVAAAKAYILKDRTMNGALILKAGDADGMVAGAVNSSANVLRAALQILKTAPGTKLVSAFFLVVVPNCEMGEHGTFIFSDAGLNQFPDARELAAIAESSAKSFELLVEAEPVVAMLSHSTKGSAHHPEIDKVIEACKIVNEECPDLKCDGELQSDAAIVPEVAASKAPGSDVAGKANVLIFPDLDAGNIGYKLVQRLAKADAYGPITQGIAKPVNDLSRGCSADDIVGVVAITAVQAQALDQK